MANSNRFSVLFNEQCDNDHPSLDKQDSTLGLELKSPLDSEKNISRTSAKKTPIKIMLGHRSYEDELREKDAYYVNQNSDQSSAYEILADKEKLASSLAKSKMCSSVGKNEQCHHGEKCRFAHSLDELKISDCLFEQRCRFVRMSNGKLVNNGEKVCSHKHPHETKETFMSRTGLDRYKCVQPSVERKTQATVAQVDQPFCQQLHNPLAFWQPPPQVSVWHSSPSIPPPTVDQPFCQQLHNPLAFWQHPPQVSVWHSSPSIPPPTVDQQLSSQLSFLPPPPPPPLPQPIIHQTNTVPEKLNDETTSDQILVIRVPKELANQALEIAMKSGKTRIQIEVVD
jgi:hypothetical protein